MKEATGPITPALCKENKNPKTIKKNPTARCMSFVTVFIKFNSFYGTTKRCMILLINAVQFLMSQPELNTQKDKK